MDCKSSEIVPGDIVSLVAPEPRSFIYDESDEMPGEVCHSLIQLLTVSSIHALILILGGPRKVYSL